MIVKIKIATIDSDGLPIPGASISFVPTSDVWPQIQGGVTDALGEFTFDYTSPLLFYFRTYTVNASASGYKSATTTLTILPLGYVDTKLVLSPVALGESVVSVDLPSLISVGSPPSIQLVNLPYVPYAYVSTIITSSKNDVTPLVSPVNPNGTCEVVLSECFRIKPLPTLVSAPGELMVDAAMKEDYTVKSYLVTGRLRRLIKTWNTTAILIDFPDPTKLYGKWFCGSSMSIERNAYADVTILLRAGQYDLYCRADNSNNGSNSFSSKPVTSDGKTPIRYRLPNVAINSVSLSIFVLKFGALSSEELIITFRQ